MPYYYIFVASFPVALLNACSRKKYWKCMHNEVATFFQQYTSRDVFSFTKMVKYFRLKIAKTSNFACWKETHTPLGIDSTRLVLSAANILMYMYSQQINWTAPTNLQCVETTHLWRVNTETRPTNQIRSITRQLLSDDDDIHARHFKSRIICLFGDILLFKTCIHFLIIIYFID